MKGKNDHDKIGQEINKPIIDGNPKAPDQAHLEELRKEAEKLIEQKKEKIQRDSASDAMQIIYELQLHQIELELQNDELRRTQEELLESQKKYSDLYDFAPVGYFTLNKQNIITEVNLTGATLLETERSNLVKKRFTSFISPDNKNQFYSHREKVLNSNTKEICEIELTKKNGTSFHAHLESIALKNSEDVVVGFRTAIFDVSLRNAYERGLSKALSEKEVLLKEIHHRVKNNLSVIVALLTLQESSVSDPKLQAAFNESINRIRSMSLIHEMLYKSTNLSEINMRDYFVTLLTNLMISHSNGSKRIKYQMSMEQIFMTIDEAIPLGLIFTELVTNVLKYAFPGEKTGLLTVEMNSVLGTDQDTGKAESQKRTLVIRDNGVGIPNGIDINNIQTLGLSLVKILTGQLGGKIEITKKAGTQFKITF